MKRTPLYSRSVASRPPASVAQAALPPPPEAAPAAPAPAEPATLDKPPRPPGRMRRFVLRHPTPFWIMAAFLLVLGGAGGHLALQRQAIVLTQTDIDNAVKRTLTKGPLPSPWSRAYQTVRPSVVRVVGLDDDDVAPPKPGPNTNPDPKEHKRSTGTGFVIVDNGTILTNLHVVAGAKRVQVTFFDGHESVARVVSTQPENDMAVLRAASIPDDLQAVTMRSTTDLLPGDEVLAVGFPFGIGPSSSGGIVSGLRRQFRAPDGGKLSNLIQFDAAANPGNSGGPLVTMDGAVVGIVTAILNPGDANTFVGIGFAVPIENAAAAVGMPPF